LLQALFKFLPLLISRRAETYSFICCCCELSTRVACIGSTATVSFFSITSFGSFANDAFVGATLDATDVDFLVFNTLEALFL
jgi:hypothetical protein